ncbi:MAG: hypothetical protein AAGK97_08830, partial [Bacteroidota bacterium]
MIRLIIFLLLFSACFTKRVLSDYDEIKKEERHRMVHSYSASEERRTGLISLQQKIIKKVKESGKVEYIVHDLINLQLNASELEQSVYWIITGEAHKIEVNTFEKGYDKQIHEETEKQLQVDSTYKEIVVGFNARSYVTNK